jgi:hypothetical protein
MRISLVSHSSHADRFVFLTCKTARPQDRKTAGQFYNPSFVFISAGRAFLFTMIAIVLART